MAVTYYVVTEHEAGQRIDNFLLKYFKKVPKSVIYRIVRKGEVRVDKKRIKPDYKLGLGEEIRIPPVKTDLEVLPQEAPQVLLDLIEASVLMEDDYLIVINKPAGLPVHGGSGVKNGLIEAFRQLRPNLPFVELVHRLDRDTSGLVLLAKSRKVLSAMHELMREGGAVIKQYKALVAGEWNEGVQHVITDLRRTDAPGRHKVQVVDDNGKAAESIFRSDTVMKGCTLMDVQILTGKMHQIRVQLAHMGYPILGDDRYGDFAMNREYKTLGLKRLFLHAAYLEFMLEMNGHKYRLEASLPDELKQVMRTLRRRK